MKDLSGIALESGEKCTITVNHDESERWVCVQQGFQVLLIDFRLWI